MNKWKRLGKRGFSLFLVLAFCLGLFQISVFAEENLPVPWNGNPATAFAGGDGTLEHPFEISNGEELAYLAKLVNEGTDTGKGKFYKLTADIDLNGKTKEGKNNKAWKPIGHAYINNAGTSSDIGHSSNDGAFQGVFIGGGHTITNMRVPGTAISSSNKYTGAAGAGLFGLVLDATICDLTIQDSTITGGTAGAFVGQSRGSSLFCNLHAERVTVTANAAYGAGGIVGMFGLDTADKTVCCSSASGSTITAGYSGSAAGGIVGITASMKKVGGGKEQATKAGTLAIHGCWSEKNTISSPNCNAAGGILGRGTSSNSSAAGGPATTIADCYNTSAVTVGGTASNRNAGNGAGGIAGYFPRNDSSVIRCYNTGKVTVSYNTGSGGLGGGGLVGASLGVSISDCFTSGTVQTTNTKRTDANPVLDPILGSNSGNNTLTNCFYVENRVTGKDGYYQYILAGGSGVGTELVDNRGGDPATGVETDDALIAKVNEVLTGHSWIPNSGSYPTLKRCVPKGETACTCDPSCNCYCGPQDEEPAPVLDANKTVQLLKDGVPADIPDAGVLVGDTLVYTITVKNTGNATATNVVISDTLPGSLEVVKDGTDTDAKIDGQTVTKTVASLEADATASLTIYAKVKTAGTINNTAYATSGQDGKGPGDDAKAPEVTAKEKPALSEIEKALATEAEAKAAGIDTTGIAFPVNGEVKLENGSVTLLYKLTVKGTAGASYIVTDEYAVWVKGEGTQQADDSITGVIAPGKTSAVIYVKKTFNAAQLEDGRAKNTAYVQAGDGSELKPPAGVTPDPDKGIPSNPTDTGVTETPNLRVQKTLNPKAGGGSYVEGDTVTWTITVTNDGDLPLTGLRIEDILTKDGLSASGVTVTAPAGINTDNFSLESGESVSFTATLPNAAVGSYSNTGRVTKDGETLKESDPSDVTIGKKPAPALESNKTVQLLKDGKLIAIPAEGVLVGDTLVYTITAKNTGNAPATNVVISDTLPDSLEVLTEDTDGTVSGQTVTKTVASLAPGQTATLTIYARVKTAGKIENIAHITSGQDGKGPGGNPESPDVTAKTPVLESVKTVQLLKNGGLTAIPAEGVFVGDTLVYTITVKNTGDATAVNVVIRDTLPDSLEVVKEGTDTDAKIDGQTVTKTVGSLKPEETATLTIYAKVKTAGKINNTAYATSGEDGKGPGDDADAPEVTAKEKPALSGIEKALATEAEAKAAGIATDGIAFPVNGEVKLTNGSVTLLYKLTVKGTAGASYIVTDEYAVWVKGEGTQQADDSITGVIAPGKTSAVIYVKKTFNARQLEGGKAKNTAYVQAGDGSELKPPAGVTPDPDKGIPSNPIDIDVTETPNLRVQKTLNPKADGSSYVEGDTVTWTITVTNDGDLPLTGLRIEDILTKDGQPASGGVTVTAPAGINKDNFSLESGESVSFTATLPNAAVGSYSNTGRVTKDGETLKESDPSDVTIGKKPAPALESNKTVQLLKNGTLIAIPAEGVLVGDTLVYTITAKNTGDAPATNVVMSDTLPDSLEVLTEDTDGTVSGQTVTKTVASLAPGQTATLTIYARVKTAGKIENIAHITSGQDGKGPGGNPKSPDVTANQYGIRVVKRVVERKADGYQAGDTASYEVTITNNSTAALYDLLIDDTMDAGLTLLSPETVKATLDGQPVTLVYRGRTVTAEGKTVYTWEMSGVFDVGQTVVLTYGAAVANESRETLSLNNIAHGKAFTTAAVSTASDLPRMVRTLAQIARRAAVQGSDSQQITIDTGRTAVEDWSNQEVEGGEGKPSSSITVLPTPETFPVTFDPNGGAWGEDTTPKTVTVTEGLTIAGSGGEVPADPTNGESTFLGWYTAAEGGTRVEDLDTRTFTGSVTFYAHWEPKDDPDNPNPDNPNPDNPNPDNPNPDNPNPDNPNPENPNPDNPNPDNPNPENPNPDNPEPGAPEPEDPTEDIGDDNPPLTDLPNKGTDVPKEEEIGDGDTPLSGSPKTGEAGGSWSILAILSGLCLAGALVTGKAKKKKKA